MSEDQALQSAKEAFVNGVIAEPKEPNEETDLLRYYLPPSLSVEEAKENNIILSKGNQLFLVFSNPAENKLSKVNYEQDKLIAEDAILIETKEENEMFSYLIVSPFEDNQYKVIVGIGGEKGSTITKLPNLKDNVQTLMDIIKSINY